MSLGELAKPFYSPEELSQVLSDSGYKAEIERGKDGTAIIRSAASGYKFSIYTYCPSDDPETVLSISFVSYFSEKPSLDRINNWNAKKRFAKASLDGDGDLVVDYDVAVRHASPEYIKECVERWGSIIADIVDL